MQGKIVLVTGANTGIGKVTALELARKRATVVMVARNQAKGEATLAEIKAETGNNDVHLMVADMASQASIRALATAVRERFDRLDVLVNNAGATNAERQESPDGIELTFAVNHLGYFLLTNLLLDLLKASAPSRVVSISSAAHRFGAIRFDDLQFKKRPYREWPAYGQSKLANLLFTYELARRLEGNGVTANAVHPGTVNSEFFAGMKGMMKVIPFLMKPFLISPQNGAATAIYLASAPELAQMSGQYFERLQPKRSSEASLDRAAAAQLWQISEQMTGLHEGRL